MKNSDICKIILAVILPPLGVFLERGCGADLLINILLTVLGKLPPSYLRQAPPDVCPEATSPADLNTLQPHDSC